MLGHVLTNKSQLNTECPASRYQDPTFVRSVGLRYPHAMSAPLVVGYCFVSCQSDFEIVSPLILGGQTSHGSSALTIYFQYIFNIKSFPAKSKPVRKMPPGQSRERKR